MVTALETITADTGAFYIYGVVSGALPDPCEVEGIETGSGVFLIGSAELACVVSNVSAAEYRNQAHKDDSARLAWISPRALRHNEILCYLQKYTTIIPFKFGTLCSSVDDVQKILQTFRQIFTNLLQKFRGREEWALNVYLDKSKVTQHLQELHPQLLDFNESAINCSPGEAYFLKKKRQKLIAKLTEEFAETV